MLRWWLPLLAMCSKQLQYKRNTIADTVQSTRKNRAIIIFHNKKLQSLKEKIIEFLLSLEYILDIFNSTLVRLRFSKRSNVEKKLNVESDVFVFRKSMRPRESITKSNWNSAVTWNDEFAMVKEHARELPVRLLTTFPDRNTFSYSVKVLEKRTCLDTSLCFPTEVIHTTKKKKKKTFFFFQCSTDVSDSQKARVVWRWDDPVFKLFFNLRIFLLVIEGIFAISFKKKLPVRDKPHWKPRKPVWTALLFELPTYERHVRKAEILKKGKVEVS